MPLSSPCPGLTEDSFSLQPPFFPEPKQLYSEAAAGTCSRVLNAAVFGQSA